MHLRCRRALSQSVLSLHCIQRLATSSCVAAQSNNSLDNVPAALITHQARLLSPRFCVQNSLIVISCQTSIHPDSDRMIGSSDNHAAVADATAARLHANKERSGTQHIINHMRMHPSCIMLQRPATSCKAGRSFTPVSRSAWHQAFCAIRKSGSQGGSTKRGKASLPLSMSLRLLLQRQLHRQRLVKRVVVACSASSWVDCLRITKTSITDTNDVATVDRLCRQCTRFSDPACVTSRLPVRA
jgi:hypothetical protein